MPDHRRPTVQPATPRTTGFAHLIQPLCRWTRIPPYSVPDRLALEADFRRSSSLPSGAAHRWGADAPWRARRNVPSRRLGQLHASRRPGRTLGVGSPRAPSATAVSDRCWDRRAASHLGPWGSRPPAQHRRVVVGAGDVTTRVHHDHEDEVNRDRGEHRSVAHRGADGEHECEGADQFDEVPAHCREDR